jgi:ketosteroid isomerase-like protein
LADEVQHTDKALDRIREGTLFGKGSVIDGAEGIEKMVEAIRDHVHPEFTTLMTSESAAATEWHGLQGFRDALTDWISPYESFRLEIEEAIVQEDKLVFLARQVATTKHAAVELETESATIWWMEDGLITQAVFYLDQKAALKAAGLDPGSHPGG